MNRREFLSTSTGGLIAAALSARGAASAIPAVDVCAYGGTASGVAAAISAAKEGSRVLLIEPSRWLGGMTGGARPRWS